MATQERLPGEKQVRLQTYGYNVYSSDPWSNSFVTKQYTDFLEGTGRQLEHDLTAVLEAKSSNTRDKKNVCLMTSG